MYEFDSDPNEAFNARMSHKAPKDRNYSRTESLDYRVACARGENNLGQYDFQARVTSAFYPVFRVFFNRFFYLHLHCTVLVYAERRAPVHERALPSFTVVKKIHNLSR